MSLMGECRLAGSMNSIRRVLLGTILLSLTNPVLRSQAAADVVDGFFAYCTGNNDGTGLCRNEETGLSYTCQIIPGAVIDCISPKAKDFQCVWISSPMPNGAQFWCDKNVDQMLRQEFSSTITEKEFQQGGSSASSSSINDQEFLTQPGQLRQFDEAGPPTSDFSGDTSQNEADDSTSQLEEQVRLQNSEDTIFDGDQPILDLRDTDNTGTFQQQTGPTPNQSVVEGIEVQLQLDSSQPNQ